MLFVIFFPVKIRIFLIKEFLQNYLILIKYFIDKSSYCNIIYIFNGSTVYYYGFCIYVYFKLDMFTYNMIHMKNFVDTNPSLTGI